MSKLSVKNSVNYKKKSKRSRARKRRLFAVLTLIVLAVVIAIVGRGLFVHAPRMPVAAIQTPVPVHTAVPKPWSDAERASVRAMLAQTLGPELGQSDRASILVLAADGQTLYSLGARNAVTPASVQKLVVAYSSLNILGANYRFQTILAGSHAIAGDGALDGNLWLVGSGDPSFRSTDLSSGVASLSQLGLKAINGRVAVDPSIVHGPEINPYWSASDAGEDFQTPVSGVSLDGDTVEFRVYGTQSGEPARVVVLPKSTAVHTYGTVSTGGGDSVIIAPESGNTFRFSGSIPPGIEEKFWLPVHEIPSYVGNVLQTMLASSSISSMGSPVVQTAPLDSIALWQHRSAPLPVLVKHMLYESDNHYAEQLLRTIGGDAASEATDRDGIEAETSFLRSRSIPVDGLHLVDGSGLAEANRISAGTLAHILSDAQLRGAGSVLYPLLPEGGRNGTLKYYRFTQARVHAKTGHLSDADSLAGYVDTRTHGRVAFAFLIDNSPGDPDSAYVRALDRLSEY